ncbi:hypothetical protein B0H67DRAFT_554408 [Lasiosphaeris hirsuta]|uniref:Uncharacterized protein n=1 Tax=Lasiosphaeris hirsuta TaxID=260670 RepID=A0AA40AHN7_9PEZI|nr:hypothetical protein B0H67DRAFT_554408 [Lasiosphaeris hirsuta]
MALNPYPSPDSGDDNRHKRARLRRSEATSSDSSDAGEFAIFNVRFRVAAPPPPPLPMTGKWDQQCSDIQQALGPRTLQDEAKRILAAEMVQDVLSVELLSRMPYDTDTITRGQPTILIVARWVNDSCSEVWGRAVSRIKKFVDSTRLASDRLDLVDIAIEMIAEELTLDKFISPVTTQLVARGLDTDWAHIKDKVARIMESYPSTKGHATSISLFRLGFSPDHDKNPNTVYVSVDYECRESTWPPVIREIQQYLGQFKYANLHVHLEHGNVEQCPFHLVPSRRRQKIEERQRLFNLVPKTPYQTKVNLGDDIGACNYIKADDGNDFSPLIGTLGCWLEIKTASRPDGVKVALTNYHVVRPAYAGFKLRVDAAGQAHIGVPEKDSELWKVDENGATPRTTAPRLEHPTRSKHNHGIHRKKTMVERYINQLQAKAQDDLDGMVAFFDKGENVLGTVYCASGYKRRTPNNGRLDWALIMPLDHARIGGNSLPSFETWEHRYDSVQEFPAQVTYDAPLRQPTKSGLKGLSQEAFVYKLGATTEATVGRFNGMKSEVNIAQDRHLVGGDSEEFSYIQGGELIKGFDGHQAFATKGDSGSVVWDEEGRAVGLLFRGQTAQQVIETIVYVTPIHDVFEDIKKFSQGAITEIRIAEAGN